MSLQVANGQNLSSLAGNPAYVGPEVLTGQYTKKVDVRATVIILYALLIGRLPFCGDSVDPIVEAAKSVQLDSHTDKWKSVAEPAKDLLSRMLSRDVEKRVSPEEALNHPWLLFYTKSDVELFKPDRKQDTDNLVPEEKCLCRNLRSSLVDVVDNVLLSLSEKELKKTNMGFVDVLCDAISQMGISKQIKSRLNVIAYPYLGQSHIHSRLPLCTAC